MIRRLGNRGITNRSGLFSARSNRGRAWFPLFAAAAASAGPLVLRPVIEPRSVQRRALRTIELVAESADEQAERILHFRRQRQIGVQQFARAMPKPFALVAPPGKHVDNIDIGRGEPGKIIAAKFPFVIFIETLLGNV